MDTSVGGFMRAIIEHAKSGGVIGIASGIGLVIAYCGNINFYPSGLTIADTLFFLWVIVVFGFYYSLVVFGFFVASIFWVCLFRKPLNFALRSLLDNNYKITIPSLKRTDLIVAILGGLLANILIVVKSNQIGHPFTAIFGAMIFINIGYIFLANIPAAINLNRSIVDKNGVSICKGKGNPQALKLLSYALIYFAPLFHGQVGGGLARETFETMGIRQQNVSIYFANKEYGAILNSFKEKGLISNLACGEICQIEKVNILFTNIGSNSKIEMQGKNGSIRFVLPTESIKLIAYVEVHKPSPE